MSSGDMLALCKVTAERNGLGFRTMPVPEPGPGMVRIKVAAAGVCGTDIQIYNWAPRMARRMALPRVLGHEVCGTIDLLGPEVAGVSVGQQVALESHIFCGTCHACRSDRAHLCENTTYPGVDIDGGFAAYLTVPSRICWAAPEGMAPEITAMLEPYGIAIHACTEGSGVSGQIVLINGCGPIGLMAVAVARALGAAKVIATDVNPLRLAMAGRMGADRCVNAAEEDVVAIAKDMSYGRGVDVAIEFSGSPDGFKAAFASVCRGGDFRLVGAPAHPLEVDFTRWVLTCPRVINIHGRRIWKNWAQGDDLLRSGRIDLKPLLSHVLPLSEGQRAFDLVLSGQAVKPVLVP
jgi:threonine 3-dehydrogenase